MTQKHHTRIIEVVYMTFALYQNLLQPYDGFAWGTDGNWDFGKIIRVLKSLFIDLVDLV